MILDAAEAKCCQSMITNQLRPNQVTDPGLLEAFANLPRERFVPPHAKAQAYSDTDIALGPHRVMLRPHHLGTMVQALAPHKDKFALVLGSGTGYASAILAQMVDTVVALENDPELSAHACQAFEDLKDNVDVSNVLNLSGPLEKGWPEEGPYDLIFIEAAVASLPPKLLEQMAPGARLVAPLVLRPSSHTMQATLWQNTHGNLTRSALFELSVPILPEFSPQEAFVF